jgi:membrane-bound lytic murein transglycosylase D
VQRDTWAALRDGFMLEDTAHKSVQKAIARYSRSPRDVKDIFVRGKPYMTYILDEVSQRGFPTEIVLLPFVESGFDPFAFSHGRAAGLWQFIPGTGRIYGLDQDWWHDERRDIISSTEAALDHLDKLYQQFDGDWLLALAAYNSGSGTVRSAIRRNRKAGKPTDFWHLKLPRETRAYVPRLLAISAIVRHPEKYGVSLPSLPAETAFAVVDTDGQLDIAVAAELAGITTDALHRLNPGFNRWATHPDGPHRLLVPKTSADVFRDNLSAMPKDERTRWVRHRINKGETLSHIAQKYDTTVAVLRSTNQLPGTTVRAGRHLLVPVASRDTSQYAAIRAATAAPRGRGSKTTYRVQDGDNLWGIAKKHDVTVHQVARWNRLGTRGIIRPGQELVIWLKNGGEKHDKRLRSIRYTVRNGDSLYLISRKFSVSVAELRSWNNLDKNKYLQPGQKLTLYVDVTRLSSS